MKTAKWLNLTFCSMMLLTYGCAKDGHWGDLKDKDGNMYRTVIIGNQVWMAENLKSVSYPDGTSIDMALSYDAKETNAAIYGRLYTYESTTNGADGSSGKVQGVCPKGWHIPTDKEWQTLEKFLGMPNDVLTKDNWRGSNEGEKLKETGTEHWTSPNADATDEFFFSALPAGTWNQTSGYTALCMITHFWSATTNSTSEAWNRALYHSESRIARFSSNKDIGCSVRCIKD